MAWSPLLCSARGACRAASIWSAVGHISCAAAWLEAAHLGWAWALASRGCAVALLNGETCGVVGNHLVTIHTDLVIWCPAIATASVIDLKLERSGAFVLSTLNL